MTVSFSSGSQMHREEDTAMWLHHQGEQTFRDVGITKNQVVLDFGCGAGFHTIPTARIVGAGGTILAVDKNSSSLNELKKRLLRHGLVNVHIVETSGGLGLPLKDNSIDVVLLYDVIHSYYFTANTRRELLKEIHRISKPLGLVSLFPSHMNVAQACKLMEMARFHLARTFRASVLHNRKLTGGDILNFHPVKDQDNYHAMPVYESRLHNQEKGRR